MALFDNLLQENAMIKTTLYRFIADYEHLHDEERFNQISEVLDLLNHSMELKLNTVFPMIRKNPDFQTDLRDSMHRYDDLKDVMEKMVMIHVDEPHKQFKERAEQMLALVEEQTRLEENSMFPRMEEHLSSEERMTLEKTVNHPIPQTVPNRI
jgi:hypothetical protein